MSGLRSELQVSWPNLVSDDGSKRMSNWQYEWDKHGVCAMLCDTNITSQHDYFSDAIDLVETYDIKETLAAASIVPNDNTSISSQAVVDAIKAAYGVAPVLSCYRDKTDDTSYLLEVRLCLKPGSYDLIECNSSVVSKSQSCPDRFIYPATTGN